MNNTTDKIRVPVTFAALDPYLESHIVSPKETIVRGKDLVEWGDHNAYPDYLLDLSKTVPTLRSIIIGTMDYIAGDDIKIKPLHAGFENGVMNYRGDLITEQVEDIAHDILTYGGFCLQIIRGRDGGVAEVYYIDMRYIRMNKECDVFYYSEKWGKSGTKDTVVYPAFRSDVKDEWFTITDEERNRHASSILFVKTARTQVYPMPVWAASVKACEMERLVDDYHLNAISNGFAPSAIINFNQGTPTDEMKEEIEKNVNEKYGGAANAGGIILSFNPNKESATTIEVPQITDFGDKYNALSSHSRQQIFTAFRANPNLFGIPTEGNGFANEQYEESFTLYNRTTVLPTQRMIADAYDRIYGEAGVLQITPFSMGDNGDTATSLASQLGVGGTQSLMSVLESATMTNEQKLGTLQVLFGLDAEAAHKILNIPYTPTGVDENENVVN